jgi:hypothetical protein
MAQKKITIGCILSMLKFKNLNLSGLKKPKTLGSRKEVYRVGNKKKKIWQQQLIADL